MMRRLVHPEAAAAVLVRVPAAEVIGAVVHVEIPREVDRQHFADLPRHEDFLDRAVLRRKAVVEGDDDLLLVALLGVEHRLALLLVDDHRLLGHHVEAPVERADDVLAVVRVLRRHHHDVGLRLVEHLVEVGERRTVDAHQRLRRLDALRVDVAETDELDDVGVALPDLAAPHAGGALAGADDGVAPAARGRLRERVGAEQRRRGDGTAGGLDEIATVHEILIGHSLYGSDSLTVEFAPSRLSRTRAPAPASPSSCRPGTS